MIKPDRWIRHWAESGGVTPYEPAPRQRRLLRRAGERALDLPDARSGGLQRPLHQALPRRSGAGLDPRVRQDPARRRLRPQAQVDARPAVDQPLAGRLVRPRLRGQHHPRAAEPGARSRSCSRPAAASRSSSSSAWSRSPTSLTASRARAATTRASAARPAPGVERADGYNCRFAQRVLALIGTAANEHLRQSQRRWSSPSSCSGLPSGARPARW